jgi:hypothetical protein
MSSYTVSGASAWDNAEESQVAGKPIPGSTISGIISKYSEPPDISDQESHSVSSDLSLNPSSPHS